MSVKFEYKDGAVVWLGEHKDSLAELKSLAWEIAKFRGEVLTIIFPCRPNNAWACFPSYWKVCLDTRYITHMEAQDPTLYDALARFVDAGLREIGRATINAKIGSSDGYQLKDGNTRKGYER